MQSEVDYIYEIPKFVKKASLDNTREMLRRLGNPEAGKKIIHVAGTNGKGSVCAYLESILREYGFRVGKFVSPHLVDIRERICLDGEMVSKEEFERTFARVKEVALAMQEDGFEHPSFFEFLFGMGMDIFGRSDMEYIILEVGLGGRLDATNALSNPILSVITSISLDHTEILGDTHEKIAREKAGIIKPGVPVVFLEDREDVSKVILETAVRQKSPVRFANKAQIQVLKQGDNSIDFSLYNGYYDNERFCVHSSGLYQTENASLALLACEELGFSDFEHIRRGLLKTNWTARMQPVLDHMVLDGGHNEDGIARFLESVQNDGMTSRVLLFSVVADKHYEMMIRELCASGLFERIEAAKLSDNRALSLENMKQEFAKYPKQMVQFHETVSKGFEAVCKLREEGKMVYVVGSLYLAGEVLALLKEQNHD